MGFEVVDLHYSRRGRDAEKTPVLVEAEAAFPSGAVSLVTGENGAGKTTLLHLLAGLLRPERGEVYAGGQPVSRWTAAHRDQWRRKVGIVFQDLRLVDDLTAFENVMLPGIPRRMPVRVLRKNSEAALELLGISGLGERPTGELSGGERQRVALARAVAFRPDYLLADEVFSHQDDEGTERVADALRDLAAGGAAVVLSAHDLFGLAVAAAHVFRIKNQRLEHLR